MGKVTTTQAGAKAIGTISKIKMMEYFHLIKVIGLVRRPVDFCPRSILRRKTFGKGSDADTKMNLALRGRIKQRPA